MFGRSKWLINYPINLNAKQTIFFFRLGRLVKDCSTCVRYVNRRIKPYWWFSCLDFFQIKQRCKIKTISHSKTCEKRNNAMFLTCIFPPRGDYHRYTPNNNAYKHFRCQDGWNTRNFSYFMKNKIIWLELTLYQSKSTSTVTASVNTFCK